MRLNPVYKKEMRLQSRTIKFPMIVFFYNALLAAITLLVFYLSFSGNNRLEYRNVLSVYAVIVAIEFVMVAFLVPAFTAGSIAGERERQTLELLLTTKMKPMYIILGKLASSISNILILFISSFPIIAIVFAVGGVHVKDILQIILLIFVTAIFIGSFGMFFSTLFKKTVTSTVFTYGTILLLTAGTFVFILIVYGVISIQTEQTNLINPSGYQQPNVGNLILVLLVNPVYTILSLMGEQFYGKDLLRNIISMFGDCNPFILEHWFTVSVGIQIVISIVMLSLASKMLDPLKAKNNKSKIKKEKKMMQV